MKDRIIDLIKSKVIECPKNYNGYDQRNDNCPICGQAKLYQVDHYNEDRSACAGWVHPLYGPMSCESYVEESLIDHTPVKLKCYMCNTETDQQNIIITSKGNLCLLCDPESLKDIPRMDVIGIL